MKGGDEAGPHPPALPRAAGACGGVPVTQGSRFTSRSTRPPVAGDPQRRNLRVGSAICVGESPRVSVYAHFLTVVEIKMMCRHLEPVQPSRVLSLRNLCSELV